MIRFIAFRLNSVLLTVPLLLTFTSTVFAQHKYMGTGSCSSSNCHGSAAPRNASNVFQNEYVTWIKHDRHSQAYAVLTTVDAKKMASHLGIGDPTREKMCLDCHATNVSDKSLQGDKFVLEDGVTCESCHGAAGDWISTHAEKGGSRETSLKNGMKDIYPLEARAELCLSCHYGSDDKMVNHRMYGAGHPRLSFELDTYGMLQPYHWAVDKDYQDRKGSYSSIRAWLVGQSELSGHIVSALSSPKRSKNGIWPELSLFNCYACHHSLTTDQWKSRSYTNGAGELRLNLSSLEVLQAALDVLDGARAKEVQSKIDQIHKSYKQGEAGEALKGLGSYISGNVTPFLLSTEISSSERNALLHAVVKYSAEHPYLQYEEAEQLAMAMSSVLAEDSEQNRKYKANVDAIYKSLEDQEQFVAEKFSESAKGFLKSLS